MHKNLFLLIFSIFLLLGLGFAGFSSAIITLPNPLCPGGSGSAGCIQSFPDLITAITNFVLTLIAGLAVIMFIWAGILFVTSAGNEQKIASARKALWWAVIGTAIALAGKGLVEVIKAVIGAS